MTSFHFGALRARLVLRVAALLSLALCASPALALSYVMIRDDALADRSDVVVTGEAVAELPGARDANGYIVDTRYLIEVERKVKGRLRSESLTLSVPGAEPGTKPTLYIPGAPRLKPGARVLLFLQPRADGSYAVADVALGVFHEVEAEGKRLYVRDLDGAHEAGKRINEQFHQPRDAARFEQWLVHRANGWRRQADYFDSTSGAVLEPKFTQIRDNSGRPLRWFKFDAGTAENWYALAGGQTGMVRDEFALFGNALAAWTNDLTSNIRLAYAGTTTADAGDDRPDGRSTIMWNDPQDDMPGGYSCSSGGTLAFGGPYVDGSLINHGGQSYHRIVEGFIVIQNGVACVFDGHNGKDGEETMAHELGHTLGLAHSCGDEESGSCSTFVRNDALMRASIHADGRGAALRTDDIAAMALIYPVTGGALPGPKPDPLFASGFE